jgi:hypothetical protein
LENSAFKKLNLPFKGNREYLHGTDIFMALVEWVNARGSLSIIFYRLSKGPFIAGEVDRKELAQIRQNGDLVAVFAWQDINDRQHLMAVVEDVNKSEERRVPYDETNVTAGSIIKGCQIQQVEATSWTFIERIVALNKKLLIDWTGEAIWLFTRLDITDLPKKTNSIKIEVEGKRRAQLLKSAVVVDDFKIGYIYFMKVQS